MAERGVGGRFKRKRPCRSREPERDGSAAGRVRRRRRLNSDNLAAREALGVAAGTATSRMGKPARPVQVRHQITMGHEATDTFTAEQCLRRAVCMDRFPTGT